MLNRNAEYLRVSLALNDLRKLENDPLTKLAIEYLEERKIQINPIFQRKKNGIS